MLRVIFCTDADVDGGGGEGSQKNMDDVLKLTRETLNVSKTLSKTSTQRTMLQWMNCRGFYTGSLLERATTASQLTRVE